jgi:hypothetical protein
MVHRDARREPGACRSSVAEVPGSAHPPLHLPGADAELVLEGGPHPQGAGLLVLGDADALARKVPRTVDTGVVADEDVGVRAGPTSGLPRGCTRTARLIQWASSWERQGYRS